MNSSSFSSLHPTALFSFPTHSKPHYCISLKPFSPKLRASYNSPKPSPKTLPPLPSLLKPIAITAAAAAALLFARFSNPFPAAAAVSFPPTTVSSFDPKTIIDDSTSLRTLMEARIKAGMLPEAIAIVDRLIALEPDEKELPLLRSLLQIQNGEEEAAKLGFERLLEKDPLLVEAYHGLIMAASESPAELDHIAKRIEGAMELCRKEKRKEDLRDFKLLVAQIRVVEGKYEESLKIYTELVKEDPKDFRPYLCQGIIYSLMRKKDEAEKQFEKYRGLVPKDHPHAQHFDDGMIAMKVFGQIEENRRHGALKN
ncbi:protein SLOW GREEN 1, chloroplastic-like [Typha latifolia]|uniref:protein SLOW GREEN 1, chloroplastic-like n=1 Tax=Typha latifolia TaxID=4733 RepID=UPI003C2F4E35